MAHMKHLCSYKRLPFTLAYFGAMLATLYAALVVSQDSNNNMFYNLPFIQRHYSRSSLKQTSALSHLIPALHLSVIVLLKSACFVLAEKDLYYADFCSIPNHGTHVVRPLGDNSIHIVTLPRGVIGSQASIARFN